MSGSFIDSILIKRSKVKFFIKTSSIAFCSVVVVYFVLKIVSFFVLNTAIKHSMESIKSNPLYSSVSYEQKMSFFKQQILIKNLEIATGDNKTIVDNITIKKTSGIVVPNELEVIFFNMKSNNSKKTYFFEEKTDKNIKLFIRINTFLFKKPTFGGLKIEKPMNISVLDNTGKIGNIKTDVLDVKYFENKNKEGFIDVKSKTSIMFNDFPVFKFITLAGQPFSWDIDFKMVSHAKKWGINKENTELIGEYDIKKIELDHSFAKATISGKMTGGNNIKKIDATLIVSGYKKLLAELTNLAMLMQPNNSDFYKKLHVSLVNDVLPMMINRNKLSNANKLVIDFYKTNDMSEMTLNGVEITKVADRIFNSFNK